MDSERHISKEEKEAVYLSASHFAEAVHAYNSDFMFSKHSKEAVTNVASQLPLHDALGAWYEFLSPTNEIEISKRGNWRKIYCLDDLVDSQIGYRWNNYHSNRLLKRADNWPDEWIVIGDDGADPVIADTSHPAVPIYWDMHGMGSWLPSLLAPSLAAYLEAEACWIEICLIQTGASRIENWSAAIGHIWEGRSYRTDIADKLRTTLEPIVGSLCLSTWGL